MEFYLGIFGSCFRNFDKLKKDSIQNYSIGQLSVEKGSNEKIEINRSLTDEMGLKLS